MAIGQPWHWIAVGASKPDFLQKCKDMHSHWCGIPEHTLPKEVNRQTNKTQLYELIIYSVTRFDLTGSSSG